MVSNDNNGFGVDQIMYLWTFMNSKFQSSVVESKNKTFNLTASFI
jgi:hypothetical protein